MKTRLEQFVLIASTLGYCWLGMQIVHELGHVLTACASGETIHKIVLHPLVISRTDVSHDRHPLLVVWGGPALGSSLPLVLLAVARSIRCTLFYLFQFFAGFCLIANGVYLGIGSFGGLGDAGDLLRHRSPQWTLIAFGPRPRAYGSGTAWGLASAWASQRARWIEGPFDGRSASS